MVVIGVQSGVGRRSSGTGGRQGAGQHNCPDWSGQVAVRLIRPLDGYVSEQQGLAGQSAQPNVAGSESSDTARSRQIVHA